MAGVVKLLGRGGQRFAEEILGWNRKTIRKGRMELETGIKLPDHYYYSGRPRTEETLPSLLSDIESIISPQSQADPTFRSNRVYSPITAPEILHRLEKDKGYHKSLLPSERTIRNKLNELGIRPQRVKKCLPKKRIKKTDAIFEQIHEVNDNADNDPNTIRLSIDCKAVINIGPFSRGGKNRIEQKALDHDFNPEEKLTPFGIFIPELSESHFWFSVGPVTADFMVDRIQELWERLHRRFPNLNRVVINADNGPEVSGRRTQWLNRLVDFSDSTGIKIDLAYYPPYHSKYNPVERLWGILENHWKGELLTSIEKALGLARTMTYNKIIPSTVKLVKRIYKKGVSLTKKQMKTIERRLNRLKGLEKWFIEISPTMSLG